MVDAAVLSAAALAARAAAAARARVDPNIATLAKEVDNLEKENAALKRYVVRRRRRSSSSRLHGRRYSVVVAPVCVLSLTPMQTRAGPTTAPRGAAAARRDRRSAVVHASASGLFIDRFAEVTDSPRSWSCIFGFLAHASSVLVVLFCTNRRRDRLWRLQPEYIPTFKRNYIYLKAEPDLYLQPAWIAFVWFFCSALFHAIVLTSWAGKSIHWYFDGLADNVGWWRWSEYSASGSIMLLGASSMLGTRETRVVIASTVSMGVTMFFGYLTEKNATRHVTTEKDCR